MSSYCSGLRTNWADLLILKLQLLKLVLSISMFLLFLFSLILISSNSLRQVFRSPLSTSDSPSAMTNAIISQRTVIHLSTLIIRKPIIIQRDASKPTRTHSLFSCLIGQQETQGQAQQILILCVRVMAANKSVSLAKLQESILREYKRVSYGEETPNYDVESIYYSDIPKQLPEGLTAPYKRSIILYNYSYYEMITFAVLEFVFHCPLSRKNTILQKMKGKICDENFMFGSNFIKGMLVKGLRSVVDNGDRSNKPIAQILLKNDAMNAFSQFWKEIIQEQSEQSTIKHSDVPESLAYHFIAKFLGVDFQLFWKRENSYEEEKITAEPSTGEEPISIVVFDKNLMESIISKVLEESNVSEESERGYILLLKDSPKIASKPKSNSEQIQQLRERAEHVSKKGSELLNNFRQLYRQMRESLQ